MNNFFVFVFFLYIPIKIILKVFKLLIQNIHNKILIFQTHHEDELTRWCEPHWLVCIPDETALLKHQLNSLFPGWSFIFLFASVNRLKCELLLFNYIKN